MTTVLAIAGSLTAFKRDPQIEWPSVTPLKAVDLTGVWSLGSELLFSAYGRVPGVGQLKYPCHLLRLGEAYALRLPELFRLRASL